MLEVVVVNQEMWPVYLPGNVLLDEDRKWARMELALERGHAGVPDLDHRGLLWGNSAEDANNVPELIEARVVVLPVRSARRINGLAPALPCPVALMAAERSLAMRSSEKSSTVAL